jgi:hypothetical protein
MSRSVFGPLPFWACFVLTEMYKVAFSFCIGMMNVSAFIQMVIITNIRDKSEEYQTYIFNLDQKKNLAFKFFFKACISDLSFRYFMICLPVVSKLFPITGSLTSVLELGLSILESTSENISW